MSSAKTRRERTAAILADLPDDVGQLPPGVEIDHEEIAEKGPSEGAQKGS